MTHWFNQFLQVPLNETFSVAPANETISMLSSSAKCSSDDDDLSPCRRPAAFNQQLNSGAVSVSLTPRDS